jgi:acyl-coenzyme A synthetase/AMP-(fatty) acid ligase
MFILKSILMAMFVIGIVAGIYGPALLSLAVFVFAVWADRSMIKRAQAAAADPRNARLAEPPTSYAMAKQECESMRSRF